MCTAGDFYYDKCSSSSNPVYTAYRDWMDQSRDTCWPARPTWDPLTVYAAIVGTEEAQMWEEAGTDEIDEWGHENFDTSWTSNNEYNLWFLNDDKKDGVTEIINQALCAGSKASKEFLQ